MLRQFNLINSETCDVCDKVESIMHLLLKCPKVKTLKDNQEIWIRLNLNEMILLNREAIILDTLENSNIINYITIITKHKIYKSEWTKNVTSMYVIKKLSQYLTIEEYVHTISLDNKKNLVCHIQQTETDLTSTSSIPGLLVLPLPMMI